MDQTETLSKWELKLERFLKDYIPTDPSHDSAHFKRVWKIAKEIAIQEEKVDLLVVLAAAFFHDFESLPKDHPEKSSASRVSAKRACDELKLMGFPSEKLELVAHAIEAHSFSGGIEPLTIEAQIVRDADRIEAMGAIGIARIFTVGGSIGSTPFHPTDPLAKNRSLDDASYALDHCFKKVFLLENGLCTRGGKTIGSARAKFMREYVNQLVSEANL